MNPLVSIRRQALWQVCAAAAVGLCSPAQAQTRTVSYVYDSYGQLQQQTVEPDDPAYRVVTDFVPNAYGMVTTKTTRWQDPLTGATETRIEGSGHDPRSRFVTVLTNAKNHSEQRTYDEGTGQPKTATDANQLTATWQYDGWGRKIREERPDGTATSWAYRSCIDSCLNGAVSVVVTQNWFGTQQTTVPSEAFGDTLGRVVLERSWGFGGQAVLSQRVFDSLGRLARVSRPHFSSSTPEWTHYERDTLGRVWQIRHPNQGGNGFELTTFVYNGLTRQATNAKNQTRTEVRNALGQLTRVIDDYGQATDYHYEAFGNLALTIDPMGNRIVVGYDRLGRKTALSDPDLGAWSYVVDPVGQTRRQTNAKQQVTEYDYDALGRMTRRLEPDLDSRWTYDTAAKGIGKLAESYTWIEGTQSRDHERLYNYDSMGRLSRRITRLDWDYSEHHGYDGFGRPVSLTHQRNARGVSGGPSNTFVTHYDGYGYASAVTRLVDGGSHEAVWAGLQKDAEGHVTHEQLGTAVLTQRDYNPRTGRLSNVTSGTGSASAANLQNDVYQYDALGNLTYRAQLNDSASLLQETFGYDRLNRLERSEQGSNVQEFSYDAAGNLKSKTHVGSYTYPASGAGSQRPHAVRQITGSVAGLTNPSFDYDAQGNLLSGLGRAYAWTSFDHPKHIERLDAGGTALQRTEFVYDADHQRARQVVRTMSGGTPGAVTRTLWYAGAVEKEIDLGANTTTLRTTLPMGLGFIEESHSGTAVPATASGARNVKYHLTDHLGSVLAVVDGAGTVQQRLSYDAWGRRRSPSGSDDSWASLGTIANTQDHSGYTGHEHLDQLGLVHMNARLYDPITGRHTSPDPTVPDPAEPQAFNRYSYVLNNALAFTDPTGLAYNPQHETQDGAVARTARWHAAVMMGKDDPTFFEDLELSLDPLREQFMESFARIKDGIRQQAEAHIQESSILAQEGGLKDHVQSMLSRGAFVNAMARMIQQPASVGAQTFGAQRVQVAGKTGVTGISISPRAPNLRGGQYVIGLRGELLEVRGRILEGHIRTLEPGSVPATIGPVGAVRYTPSYVQSLEFTFREVLTRASQRGNNAAWAQFREAVRSGTPHPSTAYLRNFSEVVELLKTGRIEGWSAHHQLDVARFPSTAANPAYIRPVPNSVHKALHFYFP